MAKKQRRKSISKIGKVVPQNLRFAILVAIAIFWADVIRVFLNDFVVSNFIDTKLLGTFIVAIIATVAGYFVLISWRKITNYLKKIKI
ncbi:hypothetical protein GF374_01445 [Candidatus Woesearchaeota archaeon]|nr:hypothetical protein [Candidatus Woesearchaeota archaeon]